jgi:glycosyltransferase involved in cell wall biosynthesis
MPTILLLKSEYDRAGGPENLLRTLAATIDRQRYELVLGIVRRPAQPWLVNYPSSLRQVEITWDGIGSVAGAVRQASALARREGAAIVHTHDMRSNAIGLALRARTGLPWIAHMHGWLGHTHRGRWLVYEAIDRRLIRAADRVLVGSVAAEREVRAYGIRRVEVVPNGVPVPDEQVIEAERMIARQSLAIPEDAVLIVVIGRLHPGKGQHVFLRALARVAGAASQARAVITGEGPDEPRLRSLAAELGIAGRVHFAGHVSETGPILAAADIVAVPSLKESLPLSALEAMARGRAVVASATGDLPLLIEEGVSGFTVPAGDDAALADRLLVLASDPGLRRQIGEAARRRVIAAYSAEAMARRLEASYDELAGRGGPNARN